jgi:hypothetical protein
MDAVAAANGESKVTPISFKDFTEQNETLFLELAFDKQSTLADVACEHYQDYLQSVKDINNDY